MVARGTNTMEKLTALALVLGCSLFLTPVSAWYDTDYSYSRAISGKDVSQLSGLLFPINGSSWSDIDNNGGGELIYGLPYSIYYNDENDTKIANDINEFYKVQTQPIRNISGGAYADESNLLVFMPFDNSEAQSLDFSGYNNNGTLVNTPTQGATGKIGYAYTFLDTSSEYLSLDVNGEIAAAAGNDAGFTVAMWVSSDHMDDYDCWFSTMEAAGSSDGFVFGHATGGNIRTYQRDVGEGVTGTGTPLILDGTWQHVAAVYRGPDEDRFELYVDGVLEANGTVTGDVGVSSDPVLIGRDEATGGRYFDGSIDQLFMFNYSLSPQQVTELYELNTTLGSQAIYGTPIINILDPIDTTYYSIARNLTFNVTGAHSLDIKAYVNTTLVYSNTSYTSGVITTINITQYITEGGDYGVRVWANDTVSGNEINSTTLFTVFQGVNATLYYANGTEITSFNITDSCGGNYTSGLINWYDINGTCSNLTAWVGDSTYDNESYGFTVSGLMGVVPHNFTLWKYQYFAVYDGKTSAPLNDFTIYFNSNGSSYLTYPESSYQAQISLRDLTLGINNITLNKTFYNAYIYTPTLTTNSAINLNQSLSRTTLIIYLFDEEDGIVIENFEIRISNTSQIVIGNTSNSTYSAWLSDLPGGEVSIYIEDNNATRGYIPRRYYLTLTPTASLDLNTYFLLSPRGIYYSFYVSNSGSGLPIAGALITAQRLMNTSYRTVEQQQTDGGGKGLFFLSPYAPPYRIIISADGFVSMEFDAFADPNLAITYVSLTSTGITGAGAVNYTTLWDSISYQFSPDEGYHLQNVTLEFTVYDSENALESYGWNITRYWNNTETLVNQDIEYAQPSGGSFLHTITNTTGTYYVDAWLKKAGEDEYTFARRTYIIYGDAGITGLDIGAALGNKAYWIITIVITILITGFVSQYVGGPGAGILGLGILIVFVAINPGLTIAGVAAWMIILLTAILLISVWLLKEYIPG